MSYTRTAESIRSDLLARLSEAWDWNDETARWFLGETDALQAAARAEALPTVEALAKAMTALVDAIVTTPLVEVEDERTITLCVPIAAIKPAYWAACSAIGHQPTDPGPYCARCGATLTAVVQSAEHHPGDCAAVEEAGSSPARGTITLLTAQTEALEAISRMTLRSVPERHAADPVAWYRHMFTSIGATADAILAATPAPARDPRQRRENVGGPAVADHFATPAPAPAMPTVEAVVAALDDLWDRGLIHGLDGDREGIARQFLSALAATPAPAPEAE